jgi:flagellar biosynthesis protein FliQ
VWVGMQTTVATLLFVTSPVLLACVVVNYTVAIFEQTLDTEDSPQIDRIQKS